MQHGACLEREGMGIAPPKIKLHLINGEDGHGMSSAG